MALTWQSVSPSNPAGILQASNMAGANIAKGLDILGSSMQEGAKNRVLKARGQAESYKTLA